MMQTRRILNNSAFVLAARIFEMIAGIIVMGILARYLGVADFGEYSLVMALVWISIPIISIEVPRILAVELSRSPQKTHTWLGNGLSMNIGVCLGLALAILVIDTFFHDLSLHYYTGLAIALAISLTQSVGSVFIAREQMYYDTYTTLAVTLCLIALTSIVIIAGLGLSPIFITTLLAYTIGALIALAFARKITGFWLRPSWNLQVLRQLLAGSIALSAVQILVQLLIYCGAFMLKQMTGNVEVALFQAPMRIFSRFIIVPMTLTVALLPIFCQMAACPAQQAELKKLTGNVLKFLLIIGMLVAIAAFALADQLIPLVFGSSFADASAGFKILVLGTIFSFINQFYVMLAMACDRLRGLATAKLGEFLVCLLLNFALIPQLGHLGSIWAMTAAAGLGSLGGFLLFRDIVPMKSLAELLFVAISGFTVIAGMAFFADAHYLMHLILGVVSFTAVQFICQIVSLKDLRRLLDQLRQAKQPTTHASILSPPQDSI